MKGDAWAVDRKLLRVLDSQLKEAKRRAGAHLKCRSGCFGCCIGPFPITSHDAERLRLGLAKLAERLRKRIAERAQEAVGHLRRDYPGDSETGALRESDAIFHPRWRSLPCPALDLESGACLLYAYRPIACRTYGPLVRIDGNDLPACSLNYRGVEEAERERMRVEINPMGLARHSVDETVVAYALAFGAVSGT